MITEDGIRNEQAHVTCLSCKHSYRSLIAILIGFDPTFAKCKRSKTTTTSFDPVTGKTDTITSIEYCSTQRTFEYGDYCGADGKHWQPKNNKDLFKLIKRI